MVDGKLVVDKPKLPGRVENLPKPAPQTGQVRPRDPRLNSTVCHSQTSPVNRPNFASPQTHRQNMRRPQTVRPLPDRLNQSRVDKIVSFYTSCMILRVVQTEVIFEMIVGKRRIRHGTTLDLNDAIFNRF